MAKHLTHGFAVPAAPSEREVGEKVKEGAEIVQDEEEKKEEIEEEEDFPAFDESKLPSMGELDDKQKEVEDKKEGDADG